MKSYLVSFIEKNRTDNSLIKTGWHERLRAIYVYHYKLRQNTSKVNHKPVREKHATEK